MGNAYNRDAAFVAGPQAGLAFVVANNHPLLTYSIEDCREAWFDGEVPAGFTERNALLADSITSDPDFSMVTGPLAGRDLGEVCSRWSSRSATRETCCASRTG